MASTPFTSEIALKLHLSRRAQEKLARQAEQTGRDVADVASDLIEQAVTRPSVDDLLAPFRKQVAESGMTDEQLDDFYRDLTAKVRAEKKAKSA